MTLSGAEKHGPEADRFRVAPAWSLGVLVGGRSTRMGRDKSTVPFAGGTLLEHVVRRLAPPGVPVLVSTRPGAADPACGERVDDEFSDAGPLAGFAALLSAAKTKFVLVVPCDMPELPADLGDRLLSFARGVDAVLLEVGARVEPFPALVAAEAAEKVRALLVAGGRRADAWHETTAAAYVPFGAAYPGLDPVRVLCNVNDPAALSDAERRLRPS